MHNIWADEQKHKEISNLSTDANFSIVDLIPIIFFFGDT